MLKLHWGEPKHPTEIRAWTGALCSNVCRPKHCFTSHEIGRWYGVSFKRSWFLGFSRLKRTVEYRTQDPPRVGLGDEQIAGYVEEANA